jgi:hypothetical protein
MMEKYASTYRQEMGWCLRISSSNIIQCSKGIGSKNGIEKQLDRQPNGQTDRQTDIAIYYLDVSVKLLPYLEKNNILFPFSSVARLQKILLTSEL